MVSERHLPVVCIVRLKYLIDLFRAGANHPKVNHTKQSDVLIIFIFDKLKHNLHFWLNLKHLQQQTHKLSWPSLPSVSTPNVFKLSSFINNSLCI